MFEGIGNILGKFITIDDVTKARSRMLTTRLCIMVEFEVKVPDSITLEVKIEDIKQELWYETNNYLYSLCNQVGDIMKS